MMQLSTMWKVVETVREGGVCPLAEEILRPWGFDAGSVRFVRASANFVAVCRRNGRRQFLRFNADSERSLAAIQAEARLVDWLAGRGVPVAAPVPSGQGRLVETAETELGRFHAVLFDGLEGEHIELGDCQQEQFGAWGAALGRLHTALADYRDPSAAQRASWANHLQLAAPYVESRLALEAEWRRLQAWAAGLPTGPADYGLIHYDFESDNLCWQDRRISALDFDDCAHHWYGADIAYALRDLFEEGATAADPRFLRFLAGYEAERPVNRELLAEMPNFLRLHAMHRYGRLCRALDLADGPEPPAWLKRLEAKLQSIVSRYEEEVCT